MRLKICYVDDESFLCENFKDYYSSDQVDIVTFVDPSLAIEYIRESPPDIIFVDYRMPYMTGDEFALALDPTIPKILITGDLTVQAVYKFDKILPKPYSLDDVTEIISEYSVIKKCS